MCRLYFVILVIFIEMKFIYNIILVSGLQHSNSIFIHYIKQSILHLKLFKNM